MEVFFIDYWFSDEMNECLSSPCVNGDCNDVVNGYNCVCHGGWTGAQCDGKMNCCSVKYDELFNALQCVNSVNLLLQFSSIYRFVLYDNR